MTGWDPNPQQGARLATSGGTEEPFVVVVQRVLATQVEVCEEGDAQRTYKLRREDGSRLGRRPHLTWRRAVTLTPAVEQELRMARAKGWATCNYRPTRDLSALSPQQQLRVHDLVQSLLAGGDGGAESGPAGPSDVALRIKQAYNEGVEEGEARMAARLRAEHAPAPQDALVEVGVAEGEQEGQADWLPTVVWSVDTRDMPPGTKLYMQRERGAVHEASKGDQEVPAQVQRILDLVDAYRVRPDKINRMALEAALAVEFQEGAQTQVRDLVLLINRLSSSLRSARPDSTLPGRAMDLLRQRGLVLSPLRASHPDTLGGPEPDSTR